MFQMPRVWAHMIFLIGSGPFPFVGTRDTRLQTVGTNRDVLPAMIRTNRQTTSRAAANVRLTDYPYPGVNQIETRRVRHQPRSALLQKSKTMPKYLQINLHGCKETQALLHQTATERTTDLLFLSEYHHVEGSTWYTDKNDKTAIVL